MAETGGNPTDVITVKSAEGKKRGIVKTYNCDRGFGFIKEDISNRDFFFHFRQYENGNAIPQIGVTVIFETEQTNKGEQAKNIKLTN